MKLIDREPTHEMLKAIASSDCAPSNYKQMFQSAYDAAPEVKQEHFDMFEVFVQHDRIYFAIGNQSFQLAFVPEDEPDMSASQVAEWYMDQLRHALSSLQSSDAQAEIAKRDARIESLTAAGAEYQRQCFEQAAEIARLKSELQDLHKRNYVTHSLFETGDTACPEQAKDRNGEVVLGVCKNCGRIEVELAEPCDHRKEISRLKGVIAKCEDALNAIEEGDFALSDYVEIALAAIKEEGL